MQSELSYGCYDVSAQAGAPPPMGAPPPAGCPMHTASVEPVKKQAEECPMGGVCHAVNQSKQSAVTQSECPVKQSAVGMPSECPVGGGSTMMNDIDPTNMVR